MKKIKMTKKDIRKVAGCRPVVSADYLASCYLKEKGFSPVGYGCGAYGWNYDVYEVGGVVIVAGYRPGKWDGEINKTITASDWESKDTNKVIRELLASVKGLIKNENRN